MSPPSLRSAPGGYLGRVARRIAFGESAPKPTMTSTSPLGQSDQLPMVDGLESIAPPTGLEAGVLAPAVLDDDPARAVAPVEPVVFAPTHDRDLPPPARVAPAVGHADELRDEDRRAVPPIRAASEHVPTPIGASPIATREPASAIERAATPTQPVVHVPTGAYDLAALLGRISREIADANRDLPLASALDVGDDTPLPTALPAVDPPRSPARADAPTAIPGPARAREPVALPVESVSPTQPAAIGSDDAERPRSSATVTIGELHIEVVHEAAPPGRRARAEPTRAAAPKGRGPIAARPSKRRFAAGRE